MRSNGGASSGVVDSGGIAAGAKMTIATTWFIPSNFLRGRRFLDLFSEFLPAATTLHKEQGCLPSKVRWTASEKEVLLRLSTSIVVQATV